jgi:hypothetical protein
LDHAQLDRRLKQLDPRLERIYRDAKNLTLEKAAAMDDDFHLSAMILRVFRAHFGVKRPKGNA